MQKKKQSAKPVKEPGAIAEKPNERAEPAVQTAGVETGGNHGGVAALAYKMWQERGCPFGSDQEDWFRAENEIKSRKALAEGAS